MKKYVKPTYQAEGVEVQDVILSSIQITYIGEGTLGEITGTKAQAAMSFDDIFGSR